MPQRENLHRAIVTGDIGFAVADVRPNPKISAPDQIGIYREGYILRLAAAITADYPALQAYLGAEPLATLVQAYIPANPSISYNLDFYPLGFATFVQDKIPPAAASLATLEGAIAEVFVQPDSPALAATALAGCNDVTLGGMIFRPREALRLLHMSHDAEEFWQAHKQNCAGTISATPIYLGVCRDDHHDVKRHRLASVEYFLLKELLAGKEFNAGIATIVAQSVTTEAELTQHIGGWLQRWLTIGFFTA